jgi:peptide/nickel transport system ATP-binding protein
MADEHPVSPVLTARKVTRVYRQRRWFTRREDRFVRAVSEVSLSILRSSRIALVGESGCGKSTLARCLAGLEPPDSGEILINDDENLFGLSSNEQQKVRRRLQLIQQDAIGSLNPRMSLEGITGEPLAIGNVGRAERGERAKAMMDLVGLPGSWAKRKPGELSGGQRQRLAIARALCAEPQLLILDEALSGLDLPVQSQMIDLLLSLHVSQGLAYVFITHDLRLAAHICDQVAVMHRGMIVETAATDKLFRNPTHDYTRQLIRAIPRWKSPPRFDRNPTG